MGSTPKMSVPRYIIVKLLNTKDKENIFESTGREGKL